ncbi:MAG: AraC family transcriptional regulator [Clostridiales bacterium]|nr:AraC family transcriptional regulator [Clostridiales bacterium]
MEGRFEKDIFKDSFKFRLFINNGSCGVQPHWHKEIEIIYITQGGVNVGISRKIFHLNKGDILLIGSADAHYFLPAKNDDQRVVIQFDLSIFDDVFGNTDEIKSIKSVFAKTQKISSQWNNNVKVAFERYINELIGENARKERGYMLAIKARLIDIAVLLLRYVPQDNYEPEEVDSHKKSIKRLENVFEYISNNYANPITLYEISKVAGFSIYHFSRFFKNNTDITFHKYLNSFRITKAEWFLMNSDDSITQIAYKTGFLSIKTFNKVFKDMKGCSPTQYRKEQNIRSS